MQIRVVRSGLTESIHDVSVTVVDPHGDELFVSGELDRLMFLRSTAKPFQGAVSSGLWNPPDPETLAVTCSSHDGLPVHVALIERLLASVGLDESHLATPPGWPSWTPEAHRQAAQGVIRPRRIWNNCSGKHAGMLAACVSQGWSIEGYTDPDHPVQQAMAAHMVEVFGEETLPVGVDGCGAPVFRGSVRTLARGYARLLVDERYAAVRNAMHRFPVLTSGPDHADAQIATWIGGIAKRGAEGTLGIALPGRGAIGIKAWDGAERAVAATALATLEHLNWIPHGPAKALKMALARPVFGGGEAVGTVTAHLEMEDT
jgi:L-asparaginase II